jgi:hypothetical protein
MARHPHNKVLYKRYTDFSNLCLIQNRSLLWPDKEYWTLDSLHLIKKNIVDSQIFDIETPYQEKLKKLMSKLSSNEWAVICDIFYIYFLPSNHITFGKKVNDIAWAAQQAGIDLPPKDSDIWIAQKHGFTRTGIKYHLKYTQFWLIILFAIHVKEHENKDSVIGNHQVMQQSLDMILEAISKRNDRAYDMRHAMLHMAFPDIYEKIISTQAKERIVEEHGSKIKGPIPSDIDECIILIRKELAKEYDQPEGPFDFYKHLGNE